MLWWGALALPVAVQSPLLTVGIENVGQKLQLLPLLSIVGASRPCRRISAFTRSLDLYVTDDRVGDVDGIIGSNR